MKIRKIYPWCLLILRYGVPHKVLWWLMEREGMHIKYVNIIKDMYEGAVRSVNTVVGDMEEFPITMSSHQRLASSPYCYPTYG